MSPEKINLPLTESTLLAQLQRPYVKGKESMNFFPDTVHLSTSAN